MNVTLSPEFENLVAEKLRRGEFRSPDEIVNEAMRLYQQREGDRETVRHIDDGAAVAVDDRFDARLEMLLEEAEQEGEAAEMTEQDWEDIRKEGLARFKARRGM